MKKTIIVEIVSVAFILLFVYAATAKLIDYQRFKVQIGQSPLLTTFAGFVALMIPIAELLIAIMLAMPRFRLVGLYAAFSLMIMFTAYIIAILNFSDHIPCSCGGVLEKLGWTEHLIFNLLFVGFALTAIILYSKQENRSTIVA